MRLGQYSFLLQNYFVEAWAGNCMMHVMVTDLDAWWTHIASLDLPSRYGVQSPRAPKLEPWGLNTAYVFDPSGVLWHFAKTCVLTSAAGHACHQCLPVQRRKNFS